VLLGNVALRAGKKLTGCRSDDLAEQIPEAEEFLASPVREGWEF
jgi:hypothetical protein